MFSHEGGDREWQISDLVCTWYRPHFDASQVCFSPVLYLRCSCCLASFSLLSVTPALRLQYPYLPPHVTKPKERKHIYLLQLPRECTFEVPNMVAVPLFELYGNQNTYGQIISTLPQLLSK